ncbi:MAG: Beta-barrel assembly-enhancing protease [Phycisphaerae bacterium]|nr:Beta-barrel assembly-enhancing protease [Phycisphaerae bacterium]
MSQIISPSPGLDGLVEWPAQRPAATLGWKRLLLIFCLALGLRLIYLAQVVDHPLFQVPQVDSQLYYDTALKIMQGQWSEGRPFFRAPLYPIFLAGAYRLTGESWIGVRVVQDLLGSLSCLLIAQLATRLYDRRAGLLSGLLSAGYAPLIFYDNELFITVLEIFLLLITLWILFRLDRAFGLGWHFLAGLGLGLASIARPNFLIIIPVAFIWIGWAGRKLNNQIATRTLSFFVYRIIAYVVGCILPILPVTLYNYWIGGEWVLISTQGGINFYMGNSAQADGKTAWAMEDYATTSANYVDNTWSGSKRAAEEAVGHALSDGQVSAYWMGQGRQYWSDHPLEASGLLLRKIYYFFNGFEIECFRSIYIERIYSPLMRVLLDKTAICYPWGLIAPLGLIGIWLPTRSSPSAWLLRIIILVYMLSVVAFLVNGRLRMPVVPLLIIFASGALVRLYEQLKHRAWRNMGLIVLSFVGLIYLSNSQWYNVRYICSPMQHGMLAFAYAELGQYEQAIDHYRQELQSDPDSIQGLYGLALALSESNRNKEACSYYARALDRVPDNGSLLHKYGRALWLSGETERGRELLEQALAIDLEMAEAHLDLASAQLAEKAPQSAIPHLQEALRLDPENAQAHYTLARALIEVQRVDEAYDHLQAAVQRDDHIADAHLKIGKILSGRGETVAALAECRRAVQLDPQLAEAHLWVGILVGGTGDLESAGRSFAEAVLLNPNFVEALQNLAIVRMRQGDYAAAWPLARRAEALGSRTIGPLMAELQQLVPEPPTSSSAPADYDNGAEH